MPGSAAPTGVTTATSAPAPIGLRVLRLVDRSRVAVFRDGRSGPRTLVTYVRYPRSGRGPFPLIVFGHGFALLPGSYAKLLNAWTRAGFVVAAPVFPVENEHAPGGPDENDLSNQPGDMSFVISRLLASSANPPSASYSLFRAVARPKYLLRLLGAGHLPPYTTAVRQLEVVERVTIAFLDRYLRAGSLDRLVAAGRAPGIARLTSDP